MFKNIFWLAVLSHQLEAALTSSRCLAIGPYTFNEVRRIRPIVLNRKNALFRGPCIASWIETCKLNGLDPEAYFTDVPWAWAAEHLINKFAAWRPPQVRKSNHQDRGIKGPLTINDVAYELVRITDALESPGLSIEPMSA
jgi:hypothetical protein